MSLESVTPARSTDEVATAPMADPEKFNPQAQNEKDPKEDATELADNAAAGVRKVEAAALVWTKPVLYAIYAWIWVAFFVLAFHASMGANVLVNAYAGFSSAPEISTAAILGTVVGGVMKLPVAKILNIWGRAEGLMVFSCLFLLGIIVLASCTGPDGYAAGYVMYYVGYNAIYLILDVFIADTSGLRNRAFTFAFSSTPFICTAFTGPRAAQSLLETTTWRWASGAFAIVFPFVLVPLMVVFKFYELKARKMGLYEETKSDRTWFQSVCHYFHEFDVIGALLLMATFILVLLPFSLTTWGRAQYESATFIAMLVIGFILFFVFIAWERFFARQQFIRYDLLKQRTVLGACLLSAILNLGYAAWDLYFLDFCLVVFDLSVSEGGYMNQIYNVGSCFFAPLFGVYIRQRGRFKNACLYFGLPLMLLGSSLMIHFRGENGNIGYVVMCQIFIAFAGGVLVIGQDMAVMAAADHDGVPMMLSILGLFASLGGAAASAQGDWMDIYLGGYIAQWEYPMGSEVRAAINAAWSDSQKYTCIATTAVVVLGFPCIAVWRNLSVDRKQNKGNML